MTQAIARPAPAAPLPRSARAAAESSGSGAFDLVPRTNTWRDTRATDARAMP